MKRKVSSKFSGTSSKGREYFGLEFAPCLDGTTLYQKSTVFVDQSVYDLVEVGMELELK